jgi:hypothetical protein
MVVVGGGGVMIGTAEVVEGCLAHNLPDAGRGDNDIHAHTSTCAYHNLAFTTHHVHTHTHPLTQTSPIPTTHTRARTPRAQAGLRPAKSCTEQKAVPQYVQSKDMT